MKLRIILATILCGFFVSAAAEPNPFDDAVHVKFESLCISGESMITASLRYGEIPMMRGKGVRFIKGGETVATGDVLFVNPKTWSWTFWERAGEDLYCVIAIGKELEPISQKDREKFLNQGSGKERTFR